MNRGKRVQPSKDAEEEVEAKKPAMVKNPFFGKEQSSESDSDDDETCSDVDSDDSDCDDTIGSESDSDESKESDKEALDKEDDEDPLIIALKKAKEKQIRSAPPEITFRDRSVMDISFHPSKNSIAAALIDGEISLFEYTNEANQLQKKLLIHKGAIRSIGFDADGKNLYSGGKDKTIKITDVETSQIVAKYVKAHQSSIYKVKPLNEHLFASGDEDGTIKLWDNRQKAVEGAPAWSTVMETKNFEEFVSDIFFQPSVDERIMVASSGEGTIMSYNLRGRKPDLQSEVYEGEMNSLGIVHKDSKLVAGCGDGKLYMFDWKEFGYHSDSFKGHPDAINHIISATENVVITACEDGNIRAVHLYPHRFIGTVGQHEHGFSVERLDISGEGELLASISHDQKIKFWSIKYLEEIDYQKRAKPFHQRKIKMRRKDNKMRKAQEVEYQLPSSQRGNRKDFFKGLDDD